MMLTVEYDAGNHRVSQVVDPEKHGPHVFEQVGIWRLRWIGNARAVISYVFATMRHTSEILWQNPTSFCNE